MKIVFATSSRIKVKIANEILGKYGIRLRVRRMEFVEPQTIFVRQVISEKARQAAPRMKGHFIVDDSGLRINALHGFPGALLKPVYQTLGETGIVRMLNGMKDRRATYVTALAFANPRKKGIKVFYTEIGGKIAASPNGNRKVGWAVERIFIPEGYTKTIAQLDEKEWQHFWSGFKRQLHYDKLGRWLRSSKSARA